MILFGHRSILKVVAATGCTPTGRGFLYPEAILRGILSGQYPSCFHIPFAPKCEVPLGFCLVAFPPPPVTDPATRLSIFRRERLSTPRLIIPDRRRSFLSERLGPASRLDLSKPFGFGSRRSERRLSAPSVRGRRVTTIRPTSRCRSRTRRQPRL